MRKHRKPQLRVEQERNWDALVDAELTEGDEELDDPPMLSDGIAVHQSEKFIHREHQKIITKRLPITLKNQNSLLRLPYDVLNDLPFNARISEDRLTLLSLSKSCRWLYHIFIPKLYTNVFFIDGDYYPLSLCPQRSSLPTGGGTRFREFLRTIEENEQLRQRVRTMLIADFSYLGDYAWISRRMELLTLESLKVIEKGDYYGRLRACFLSPAVSMSGLRHFTWVGRGRRGLSGWVWPAEQPNTNLKELVLDSDIANDPDLGQMLTMAPNIEKLSFVQGYESSRPSRRRITIDPINYDNTFDPVQFVSLVSAGYAKVRELALLDPMIGDVSTGGMGPLLRQALRTTNNLRHLTTFPQALLPRDPAESDLPLELKDLHGNGPDHITDLVPRSLQSLTLMMKEGGLVPYCHDFMLRFLKTLWRHKHKYPNLKVITLREISYGKQKCASCHHHNIYYHRYPHFDLRMHAADLKQIVSGLRHYMNIELKIEIDGIETDPVTGHLSNRLRYLKYHRYFQPAPPELESWIGSHQPLYHEVGW